MARRGAGCVQEEEGEKGEEGSGSAPAPDPLKRDFSASRTGELFPSDITYIPTFKGWLFLAASPGCVRADAAAFR